MIPIKIVFVSREFITVYSDDPSAFADSVLSKKPPEIQQLEYLDDTEEAPELTEVKLTLRSGAIMLCNIAKGDMPRAQYIEEITDCDTSNIIAYGKLATLEAELDVRFAATRLVVNNIPDLDTRLYVHTEYLKRKQAYVTAIEALVDGVIRRPNE